MGKVYEMSAACAKELRDELNYLKTTRFDEVVERISAARNFGDLLENTEYDEAKNEQAKLFSRIVELEQVLRHSVIVEKSSATGAVAVNGNTNETNREGE